MRYISEYQEPARVLDVGTVHEWRSPQTPSVATGRIRNLHHTVDLLVSVYVNTRDSQVIRIPPFSCYIFTNRPVDRFLFVGGSDDVGAVYDYQFSASVVDLTDLAAVLSRVNGRLEPLSYSMLPEYVGKSYVSVSTATNQEIDIEYTRLHGREYSIISVEPYNDVNVVDVRIIRRNVVEDSIASTFLSGATSGWTNQNYNAYGYPADPFKSDQYPAADGLGYKIILNASTNTESRDVLITWYAAPFHDWEPTVT